MKSLHAQLVCAALTATALHGAPHVHAGACPERPMRWGCLPKSY